MRLHARMAALALVCLGFLVSTGVGTANAEFGIAEFEAGTCDVNTCTYDDPSDYYTQAGGHPPFGVIDFTFNTVPFMDFGLPDGNVLSVRTDLPIGLSVNPEAVPKCLPEELEDDAGIACPAASQVGANYISAVAALGGPLGPVTLPVAVYNMEPPPGKPLMSGFRIRIPAVGPALVDETVYLVGDVAWDGDYHQFFEIDHIGDTIPVVGNRLVFDGRAGITDPSDTGFLRLPTQCGPPNPTTELYVTSHQGDSDSATTTTPAAVDGCENMPFEPTVSVETESEKTNSPSAVTVEVEIPAPSGDLKPSDIRNVAVTMPEGMGLNPSAAEGLGTCTDAQFGKGTRNPIACPPDSKIGTAAIETPVLPPGALRGNVYAGQPLSNDPASGKQFRLFMEASSERYGVSVRLVGEVSVDPDTGRLTTRLTDLPQAPFETFTVTFDGGPRAILSTPDTCGPHTTTARFVPWSGLDEHVSTSSFDLSEAPGGGPCAQNPGGRGFAPGFDAGTTNRTAGEYAPLFVRMSRGDGEQEFKAANIDLPPGITARLAGVPYCPEEAIAAAGAAGRDGADERNAPSCPAASRIGRVGITAGAGPTPYPVEGTAYLAGPYAGAPLSMVVVTPAIAGPYDLGTVAVRVALHVDPVTLQVRAVSDPIPHRLRGVDLQVRSIDVDVDRPGFSLNPTACWEKFFTGTLFGGGADPNASAAWTGSQVVKSYAAQGCSSLRFAPRMFTRFFGTPRDTDRSSHPPFRAVLQPRAGHANIRRAVVRFPKAILLDQGNIRTVCTRIQWATDTCPQRSIYGRAEARSPLLDGPLRGWVYLRSSQTGLPNLVADLRGQIRVELVGRIGSSKGGMQTTYRFVPDAPVEQFTLRMFGGKRSGLLVVSRHLCRHRWRVANGFRSQSGKRHVVKSRLWANCRGRAGRS